MEGKLNEDFIGGFYLATGSLGDSNSTNETITGFFNRKDRLYLQFRHGRLAGWKGDWGRNWMWQ